MSVDQGSDSGHLGNKIHTIFVNGVPVLGLVDTLSVSFSEFTVGLEVEEGSRQLSHGVHVVGKVLNEFFSFMGNSTSGLEFFGDGLELSLGGEFTSHQEPQETFGEGFTTVGGLGEVLDEVRDGVSSEGYTLERFYFSGGKKMRTSMGWRREASQSMAIMFLIPPRA